MISCYRLNSHVRHLSVDYNLGFTSGAVVQKSGQSALCTALYTSINDRHINLFHRRDFDNGTNAKRGREGELTHRAISKLLKTAQMPKGLS